MSNQTGWHSYYRAFYSVEIIKIHTKCIHKMMSVSFNSIQYWTKIKEFFKTSFQCVLSRFSPVRPFATLWTHQAPLSMGFSRQGYWSGLRCPPPGDLQPRDWTSVCYVYLHWQAGSLPLMPPVDWHKLLIIIGIIFKE